MSIVTERFAILVGAFLLISLGVYLWKFGNKEEHFWEAFLHVFFNVLTFQLTVFFTFRGWAVFLWIIGFSIIIIAIVATTTKALQLGLVVNFI